MSMDIAALLKDKSLSAKEKTEALAAALAKGEINPNELIAFASSAKDPDKGNCMEAFEFATRAVPGISSEQLLTFATDHLSAKAPRVKWEAAKVLGNIAHEYPKKLDAAIAGLLINTEDKGTVVRWAAAFALTEIAKLQTPHNKDLLPALKSIMAREEKNSIKKIYQQAIKAVTKK